MNESISKIYKSISPILSSEDFSSIEKLQLLKFVISNASSLEELKPIIDLIINDENKSNQVLSLILKSLIAFNGENDNFKLSESQILLWLEFLKQILTKIEENHFNFIYGILNIYIEESSKNNQQEIFNKCGDIAREIYNLGVTLPDCKLKTIILNNISRLIIDTYESNYKKSKLILDALTKLDYTHLLYKKMNKVLECDYEYIAKIYQNIIGYVKKNGNKLILNHPVANTDYYSLRNFNEKYVKSKGLIAIQNILECLNYSTLKERYKTKELISKKEITEKDYIKIKIIDKEIFYIEDFSHIWGDSSYKHHSIYSLVADIFNYISNINSKKEADEIFDCFVQNAFCADLWRRFMIEMSKKPTLYKEYIFEILMNRTMQTSIDTRKSYGILLEASLPILNKTQINKIEKFIIELPKDISFISKLYEPKFFKEKQDEIMGYYENDKENLIGLFPDDLLILEESKKIKKISQQEQRNYSALIHKEDNFEVSSRPMERYDLYDMRNIKLNELDKNIIDLMDKLDDFTSNWLNAAPREKDINDIKPIVIQLHKKLTKKTANKFINEQVIEDGWRKLAETSSTICTGSDTFKNNENFKIQIKTIINDCLTIVKSKPFDDKSLERDYLNYRTPANQAISAFVHYYRFIDDKEVFDKLIEYSLNKDSSIRNNIIESMFKFNPFRIRFFEILEIILEKEEEFNIKYMAYWNTMMFLLNFNFESVKILNLIESKCSDAEKINLFGRSLYEPVGLLINLSVRWNNKWANEKLQLFFSDMSYAKYYQDIVFSAFIELRRDSFKRLNDEDKNSIIDRFYNLIDEVFKTIKNNKNTLKKVRSNEEKTKNIIVETISMFFLKILAIGKDELSNEIDSKYMNRFDNTLEYIYKLLKDSEIFTNYPDILVEYLKFKRIMLNDKNLFDSINKIFVLAKYINLSNKKQKEDYNYSQVLTEFVAFAEKINIEFSRKVKTSDKSLSKFIALVEELSQTDNIQAVKLVWDLQ